MRMLGGRRGEGRGSQKPPPPSLPQRHLGVRMFRGIQSCSISWEASFFSGLGHLCAALRVGKVAWEWGEFRHVTRSLSS